MKPRAISAAICAAALWSGACTSDNDTDLNLGTETPSIATTTTPESTTTTTAATLVPAETVAPSTTIDPAVDAQIRADFEMMLNARLKCGQDPENCDFAAASIPGSPADFGTRDQVAFDVENHHRSIPGVGEYQWRIDAVELDSGVAYVTTCGFDTQIEFDVGDPANPDDDQVINDDIASSVIEWQLGQVDGRWGLLAAQRISNLKGIDSCGF